MSALAPLIALAALRVCSASASSPRARWTQPRVLDPAEGVVKVRVGRRDLDRLLRPLQRKIEITAAFGAHPGEVVQRDGRAGVDLKGGCISGGGLLVLARALLQHADLDLQRRVAARPACGGREVGECLGPVALRHEEIAPQFDCIRVIRGDRQRLSDLLVRECARARVPDCPLVR